MTARRKGTQSAGNTNGTSQSAITVSVPAQTVDGDLLLAVTNGPVGTLTPPAGWTLLGAFADGSVTQSNAYYRYASSEPANYTFTFPSSSACRVALIVFGGVHGILTWDANVTGTDSTPSARRTDAARDAIGYSVVCWADGASNTVTANQGVEDFDFNSGNTGLTVYRGYAGYVYGPGTGGINDIVNAGDGLPGTTFTISSAPTGAIAWQFLLDNAAPDDEQWSSTNGDFAVELKLDEVAINSLGGITSALLGDITGKVSAITSQGDTVGEEDDKLADGLTSTQWSDAAVATWAQYDFGASVTKTVRRYRLTSGDSINEDPRNWTLKGSNNGTDFTVLDTRTGQSFANRAETQEFRVADPGAYRYYRLDITLGQIPSSTTTSIAEWRLSEIDVWEDVTSYVQEESKIRITRGLQGSSGRSDFTRAYYTLKNTDGRFSLRNQDSSYYGALQRNTQTRISKAYGTKSLQLQGEVALEGTDMVGDCVRCTLTDDLAITGDIDIRIDFEPGSWRDEQMLCGAQYAADGNPDEGWALRVDGSGVLHLAWDDGTTQWDVSSEVPVPQTSARMSLRATLDVDNGASGNTVSFYTADSLAGPWVPLGTAVTSTGTTSIAYTGGALCVGHVQGRIQRGIHGLVYGFELYDGIAGTAVTDIDFTALTNGAHSFTDSNSNRWESVNNAVVSNRRYRFHGEVAEWPLAWDSTGNWVEVSVTGAGVQKRLERSNAAFSTMRRYHTRGVISDPGAFERWATPAAYWPMEDPEGAFTLSSGLPSKPGMQIYGTPQFGQSDGDVFKESEQLIKLNLAKFGGRVAGGSTGYADIRWLHYSPTGMADEAEVMEGYTSGSMTRWVLFYETDNTWRLDAFVESDDGISEFTTGPQTITTEGEAMHVRLILDQDGADVDISMSAYDVYGTSLGSWSDTFPSATLGRVFRVNVNPDGDIGNTYIGHLAVYGIDSPTFAGAELNSYHYETAGRRIERLCKEQRVDFRHIGDLDQTALMGFQDTATPFSMMSSAAVSDDGYLIDPLDAFGIEYRTLRSCFNQAPRMTLSYTGNELSGELQPVADDSYITNDFTASRGGAGSARFRETSGALSVNEPPEGVSEYQDSQSYSLAHEGQCVDIASWQVAKGARDEDRYPRIELAMENLRISADAALSEALLRVDVGDRVDITDTPDFLPAEDIRQLVVGYEEWFDNFQHNFKLNTVPERWYEVTGYDTGDHFAADDTELYQDITSSQTTVAVSTTGGPPLPDDQESYPFLLAVDGEVMRAVARGGMITSNPFFDTDTTGWSTENSTIARTTTYVHPGPTATASLSITPNGVSAFVGALSAISDDGTVSPQNDYVVSFWAYSAAGYSDVRVSASWYTSASGFISTSTGSATAIPAGEWTYFEATFTAPATAARTRVRPRMNTTPAASDVLYVWNARVTEATAFYGNDRGDSFNRADSTTNLGSTDRGVVEAWTQDLGTWGINSNQAYISASASSYATVTGAADFEEVSVSVPTWPSGTAQILFRAAGGGAAENDFVRWGGTVGSAPSLDFVVASAVTRTETADSDFILVAGDKLSARCNGSVVEVFVNDVLALCVTETDNEARTQVGMRLTTTAPRMENFYFRESKETQEIQVERGYNEAAAAHKSQAAVRLYPDTRRGL